MKLEETVRLGLMPPLSGVVEIYGTEITRAAQIACKEVNDQGGVLGRPLELIIEDDGSLPESAVKAAKKLVEEYHCHAIIGNLLSNSRIAVAYRVAEPLKIPYLNFSFSEGSIFSRYFFHFAALPNQQIDRMIPYMKEKFGSKMFFAGNNYEWPRGSIDAAKKALVLAGGTVVGEEYCAIGGTSKQLENLLDKLEASGADVFVPYFAGSDQLNLLNLFFQKGLKEKIAVVMGHYDEMMASLLAPDVRSGLYSSNTYFMTVDTKENQNYLRQLAELSGVSGLWPNGNGILTNFGEGTYLCVKAFAAAANKAGSLNPEALVQALETIQLSGPQGKVEMRSSHRAKVNTFLSQCQSDGTFKIIERFGAIDPVIPERYRYLYLSTKTSSEEDVRVQSRIVEQMTEAVFLIDSNNGNILYVNAGGERMFQYARGELIGQNISKIDLKKTEQLNDSIQDVNQILYQKGVWTGELQNARKDGTLFWTSVSISTFTHSLHGEVWMAVFRDITEQKKIIIERMIVEEQLAESERLLSSVLSVLPVSVFVKDIKKDFKFKLWNKFAEKVFGLKAQDLIGKSDYDLFPKEEADWFRLKDVEACKSSETIEIPEEVIHTTNGQITLHTKKSIVRDNLDEPIFLVGVSEDISEIKKMNNDLRTALVARDEFLMIVSHELKTPITSLKLRVQLMQRRVVLDDKTAGEISAILTQVNRLSKLIETILDVARIQYGKVTLELGLVNLAETVALVMDQFSEQLENSRCHVEVKISPEIVGVWDQARIEQILSNLFSNAIKYAPGSQITIHATSSDHKTILSFKDTGRGISKEKQALIFNRFERADAPITVSGLGLGLYICKQIVEALGGTIRVEGQEGQGASFIIELPNSSPSHVEK